MTRMLDNEQNGFHTFAVIHNNLRRKFFVFRRCKLAMSWRGGGGNNGWPVAGRIIEQGGEGQNPFITIGDIC